MTGLALDEVLIYTGSSLVSKEILIFPQFSMIHVLSQTHSMQHVILSP